METTQQNGIRFTDIKGFMLYVGLGRNQALALANRIGCRRRVGRRVIYDLRMADRFFDSSDFNED